MSTPEEFLNYPGRPRHPDMMILSDLMLQLDGQASEGSRDIGDLAGEFIDPECLSYLAINRVRIAEQATHRAFNMRQAVTAAALYLEGFVMGARWWRRKLDKQRAELATKWERLATEHALREPAPGSVWAEHPDSTAAEVWRRGRDALVEVYREGAAELRGLIG